eukprot:TRINITY_DN793_c0_g3_i2.p1 TRINITY_DN793_c0_g3~~TRINITY_DN793_c0_g3_i2.p1  ORF type:complete len:351 (+),score=70.57 TRINITY_DN793_c0_g3_i2:1064-2116(+)
MPLAKKMKGVQLETTCCGSPGYMAPEVLRKEGYGVKADIYSCGILLYILYGVCATSRLTGISPFAGDSVSEVLENNKQSEIDYPMEHWKAISSEAVDLVMKMTEADQYKRPLAKDCLHHPWFDMPQLEKKLLENVSRNLRKFGREKNLESRDESRLLVPTVFKRALSNSRTRPSKAEMQESLNLTANKFKRVSNFELTSYTKNDFPPPHLKSSATIMQYNPFLSRLGVEEFKDEQLDEECDIPTEKVFPNENLGLKVLNGSFISSDSLAVPFSIAEEGVSKKIFKSTLPKQQIEKKVLRVARTFMGEGKEEPTQLSTRNVDSLLRISAKETDTTPRCEAALSKTSLCHKK